MNITPHFHNIVSEQLKTPFKYGENDCGLFVHSVYKKAFGIDLASDLVKTYSDELHAIGTILKLGGWDKILVNRGFSKLDNINLIQRGDVVVCENAVGIYVGNCKAVFAGNVERKFDKIESAYRYTKGES